MVINWDKLKQDLIERLLNFETAKGIYLVPAGVTLLVSNFFWQQHVWDVAIFLLSGYMIFEGFRKIGVNRIKQEIARKKLIERRIKLQTQG